ncbi:MAG TPA: hypothetical protein VHY34_09675 [Caulobacteraceae bacterium]|jgi:hypothetical protein|nr:hypothetical protein [Caulobacteraceae bacterium]
MDPNVTNEDYGVPSLSPESEQSAPDDPSFVNDCLAALDQLASVGEIGVGAQALTESRDWGLVFRADFTIDGPSPPGFINRLVCWRRPDGTRGSVYAIGQDVPPLAAVR